MVLALDLARESIDGCRRTLGISARANLIVVGLASFGFARPVASILLDPRNHGGRRPAEHVGGRRRLARNPLVNAFGS